MCSALPQRWRSSSVSKSALATRDSSGGLRGRRACRRAVTKTGWIRKFKILECRWLKPQLVGQFEFVEWTEDGHLRHSRFMGLRDDKKAKDVRRQ
jgi:ATP-dependent DNA ligase